METTETFPATVANYQLLELLDEDEFTTLHRVVQRKNHQKKFMMRVLRREFSEEQDDQNTEYHKQVRKHFLQARDKLEGLNHKHILRLYDKGLTWNKCYHYFVLENIKKRTTLAEIFKGAKFAETYEIGIHLFRQILEGLKFAHEHERQIIHSDLNPESLLAINHADRLSEDTEIKIENFGIAPLRDQDGNISDLNRLHYISPEALQDESRIPDQRSNIYSAGIILYQLLTGKLPFKNIGSLSAVSQSILNQDLIEPKSFKPDFPDILWGAIAQAIAKEPHNRFANIGAFLTAIKDTEKLIKPKPPDPLPDPQIDSEPSTLIEDIPPKTTTAPTIPKESPEIVRKKAELNKYRAPRKTPKWVFPAFLILGILGIYSLIDNFSKPGNLEPEISASKNLVRVNESIEFIDNTSGEIIGRLWDFGDGTSGVFNQNYAHAYQKPDVYTVTLTIWGADSVKITSQPLTVEALPNLRADFQVDQTRGSPPLNVQFVNRSRGKIQDMRWEFGDGEISREKNPGHTYNREGNFTAKLIVTDRLGSDEKSIAIVVTAQNLLFGMVQNIGRRLGVSSQIIRRCRDIESRPVREKNALERLLTQYDPRKYTNKTTGARYQAWNEWYEFSRKYPNSPATPFTEAVARSFGF